MSTTTTTTTMTMRQWQHTKGGRPSEVLHLVDDAPRPQLASCGDDEVVVRITHVALTPPVTARLIPSYGAVDPLGAFMRRPAVPEVDFSGIVTDIIGTNAKEKYKKGDRVFGLVAPHFGNIREGVLREYLRVHCSNIAKVPKNITLQDASCFAANGITAYRAIIDREHVHEGARVFVHGGSGACGMMCVQLARQAVGTSGYVVTTCSPSKMEMVKSLGVVDEIIDYTAVDLPSHLSTHFKERPFDYIFDTVGNDHSLYTKSPTYLKQTGTFNLIGLMEFGKTYLDVAWRVAGLIGAYVLPSYLGGVPRPFTFESTKNLKLDSFVPRLLPYMEEGSLRTVIDSVYTFDNALEAYDRMASGKAAGRVIIELVNEK
eukprot:TRINITY_DN16304_c0_g1_i1.p1 TRINITY_DN16304_c0_g1~~TRINITY_DN16304_c0_g1_i1.p1  ORF type:complete len:373 (-),score=68.38 TRINITY_DN16304_c0_g1_i1:2-1120(-)